MLEWRFVKVRAFRSDSTNSPTHQLTNDSHPPLPPGLEFRYNEGPVGGVFVGFLISEPPNSLTPQLPIFPFSHFPNTVTLTRKPASISSPLDLGTSVQYLKGVGPRYARLLEKVGVRTLQDLLFYFPRAYQDRSRARPLSMTVHGEPVLVVVRVHGAESLRTRTGKTLTKVAVSDDSGRASLVFFNARFSLQSQFEKLAGQTLAVYGTPTRDRFSLQFTAPEWEVVETEADAEKILPVYPLTEGLAQNLLRRIAEEAVQSCAGLVPECLPEALRDRLDLVDLRVALESIHFPPDDVTLQAARRRLIFEELFLLQLALAQRHRVETSLPGPAMLRAKEYAEAFTRTLPWPLTGGQQRALAQILKDLESGHAMNRLVQGDVGSGKTAVAASAMAAAVGHGYQAALMAPTEILAEQHFRTLYPLLKPAGLEPTLLTGSLSNSEKARIYEGTANGALPVVVGTHALLQEGVAFKNLGLVVVDEQHRFGVEQRAVLREKGVNPHVLVMTATPIPRTLALTLYGDLDISIIDELPPGRKPVKTHWKKGPDRRKVYEVARDLMRQGRQAYVVCPLIEESEKLQVQAATDLSEELETHIFPEFNVGLLHGGMRPADKDAVMAQFRQGLLNLLVSTTVIEVGVDVPNATVMIIEDAERFGLAQLHQLRGRVGRGEHQSFCILLSDPKTEEGKRRMEVMTETTDGFRIAEEDLNLRGPGEFYGTRQHGLPSFHIADVVRDVELLEQAREEAFAFIQADPEFERPEHALLKQAVQERFAFLARMGSN
ncbi:MAG: ATP-dependent DNA helicase RecG [Armatimonadetes bacterium]|nr:ATP-dependent DNA helicase RecG [Armatimonadota bacterium]